MKRQIRIAKNIIYGDYHYIKLYHSFHLFRPLAIPLKQLSYYNPLHFAIRLYDRIAVHAPRIIAKSCSIVIITKVWNNVKRVRKNQEKSNTFQRHAYMIYIPFDTNWNFFFAVNRIVTKIETTIRGKPSHSFHHVSQFPVSLDPYPRTTSAQSAQRLWIIYYAVIIIVSTNGVIHTFHGIRGSGRVAKL